MKKMILLFSFICFLASLNVKAQWLAQKSGVTGRLVGAKAVSDDIVWVGGQGGAVLLTTDGGKNWINHPLPDVNLRVTSIEAFDTKTAVAVCISTTNTLGFFIYRTTDGGATWTKLYDAPKSFGDAIRFFDSKNGIAIGDPDTDRLFYWHILLTSDGGATWNRLDSAKIPAPYGDKLEQGVSNGMDVIGNHVWFGTINGGTSTFFPHVYHSSDKGNTWEAVSVSDLTYIQGVAFADAKVGYAMELNGKISKTTDGGATWKALSPIATNSMRAIKYRQASNDIFVVANSGMAYLSQNDGISFDPLAPIITTILRGMTVSPTSNIVWAVGDGGIILKWDENATDVKTVNNSIPTQFSLSQNFPNPFNPTTLIQYSVPSESKISLKVYDVLGKEVASLVNETKPVGNYEVVFNAVGLSNGVYFYTLNAGAVSLTKKLIFMK